MKVLCDYCGEWFDKKPSTVKTKKLLLQETQALSKGYFGKVRQLR